MAPVWTMGGAGLGSEGRRGGRGGQVGPGVEVVDGRVAQYPPRRRSGRLRRSSPVTRGWVGPSVRRWEVQSETLRDNVVMRGSDLALARETISRVFSRF